MKRIDTAIEGVCILEPRIFEDARGYFCETYNRQTFAELGITNVFVQDNESKSTYGVVRGLHCQLGEHAQAKLVRVLRGRVLDVAVDVREGSPTFGKYVAVELSDENKRMFMIPRGCLHGFSVLSQEAVFAYKCDNLYCKAAEFGVRYDDPDIAVDWQLPAADIITSEKDQNAHSLHEVPHYRQ